MAKLCPQCEKENPTMANVCMFCGTRFVENAEPDKMDALHSELSEAKDTIKVLKEALKEKEKPATPSPPPSSPIPPPPPPRPSPPPSSTPVVKYILATVVIVLLIVFGVIKIFDIIPEKNHTTQEEEPAQEGIQESAQVSVQKPVNIEMVYVAGGTFQMGCDSYGEDECEDDEFPLHNVTVNDFYIGKYEVTQAQWKSVMDYNPSYFKGNNLPVENVSWIDTQDFIRRLNKATGKQYRLPTEAEWEYACRGGARSGGYKYSGSNNADYVAWYKNNSGGRSHSVGTKQPNELGIYDMSGNVREWCHDRFDTYPASAQYNPKGPSSGSNRVDRSCSWGSAEIYCRVSNRDYYSSGYSDNTLGFRVALSP